jgi:uncharacterized repeat protein (TIGR01451 family)
VVSAVSANASTANFVATLTGLTGSVTIPSGGNVTVTFQAQVAANASGSLINTATVSVPPGTTDTVPTNNTGTVSVSVLSADLSLVKTASTGAVSVGGTLTYSLVISNAGPSTATGASFADTLPTGLGTVTNVVSAVSANASTANFVATLTGLTGSVTIPSGGNVTVTFQAQVAANASGSLINTATVSVPPGTTDTVPTNNTGTVSVSVLSADLSLVKTASTGAVSVGGTLTYSLVISNAGPSTATGASFADTLPTGLGTVTNVVSAVSANASTANFVATLTGLTGSVTIPSGGNVTVTFQAQVAANASGS